MLPQFPLSDRYKTDFVIINSYSGAFEVFFVELEPSASRPFNRLGTPSKRLAGAVKQVDDWRSHFEAFRDETRAALVRWAEKRDILGYHTGSRPFNYFGQRLADWDAPILDHYVIVVGRSSELSPEERYLSGRFARGHSVQVMSYDRLLHLAERRYGETSQKH